MHNDIFLFLRKPKPGVRYSLMWGGFLGGLVDRKWRSTPRPYEKGSQPDIIWKLQEFIVDAEHAVELRDADYLEEHRPADYEDYLEARKAQMRLAKAYAEVMVLKGLLSEEQSANFLHRDCTFNKPSHSLSRVTVQLLLGVSVAQHVAIVQCSKDTHRKYMAGFNWFTVDPVERDKLEKARYAMRNENLARVLNILTPNQRVKWNAIMAEPPVSILTDLPTATPHDLAHISSAKVSPIFHILNNESSAYEISDIQTQLLQQLEEIIKVGLYWIGLQHAPTHEAFIHHAEQLVLLSVLTETQATQLRHAAAQEL